MWLTVAVLCFAFASGNEVIKRPSSVKSCMSTDPDFDQCTREAMQNVIDTLKKGFPERNIPPLDPMKISEIKIFETGTGPVSGNASFFDITVVGLSDIKVVSNKIDKEKLSLVTVLYLPLLRLDGRFKMKGRVLLLPIEGNGNGWLEPGDMTITAKTQISIIEKEGQKFFNITDVRIDLKLGKLKLRLSNLFRGQKALEENLNAYVNENWRVVYDSIKPQIVKTIEKVTLRVLRNFADVVPAKFLVEDI